ncbi:MAG: hypothetical protein ACLR1T_17600 [Evtepia gabavorous]
MPPVLPPPNRRGGAGGKRSPSCACTPGPSTRPRRRFPPARCAPCWGSPRPTPARAWGPSPRAAAPAGAGGHLPPGPPPDCPAQVLLPKLRQLEEEDPQLHLVWDEHSQEIHARLMGQVQIEVLQRLIADRFDVAVQVDAGRILYKETIAAPVEGWATLSPCATTPRSISSWSPCPRAAVWSLTAGAARTCWTGTGSGSSSPTWPSGPTGVLTGAPITDLRITLLSGRAHPKHTEGATSARPLTGRCARASCRPSVLLEPWYAFTLTLPAEQLGRAISDLQTMAGTFDPGERRDLGHPHRHRPGGRHEGLPLTVAAYTRGRGNSPAPSTATPLPQPEAGGGRRRV